MMMHSVCLLYILAVVLFDRWVGKRLSTAFGLLIALICFNCGVMANISYFYLDKCYERSYYIGSQMMERIEQKQEEYGEEIESIVFVGNISSEVALINTPQGNKIPLLGSVLESHLLYDHKHTYHYIRNTFGMTLSSVSAKEWTALKSSEKIQNMGIWPAEDSVTVVDDILVIKLAEPEK